MGHIKPISKSTRLSPIYVGQNMKTLTLLISGLFLVGCMKTDLTPSDLSDLIPRLTEEDAELVEYVFKGNHAGYMLAAKVSLSRDRLDQFLAGLSEDPEALSLDYGLARFEMHFTDEGQVKLPAWFTYSASTPMKVYRDTGKNRFTSEFIYTYYVDQAANIVWVEGGGI